MPNIPPEQMTNRQLLLHLFAELDKHGKTLRRLDRFMTDLHADLDELTAQVDAIGVRFNEVVDPLLEANAALRTEIEAFVAQDVIDAETAATLQEKLAEIDAAAARVQEQSAELSQIGTPPTEEPPAEEPTEPEPEPTP